MALAFDPFSPPSDPYPMFRRLRDEAPVHLSERGIYSVTRYEDVLHVLKTPEVFSSRAMFTQLMNGGEDALPPLSWKMLRFLATLTFRARLNPLDFVKARNLIAEDGGSHDSMRAIVNRGFTPRQVQRWEKRAEELVEACTAPLRRGEAFELVADLAVPLPVTLISELLGIEPERREDFKRWSDAIVELATGPGRNDRFHPRYARTFVDLFRYVRGIAVRRRRDPSDDVISLIVAEQDGEVGLDDREVVQFVMLLLVAGNETTTNWIGNTVSALLDHPDVCERLAEEPGSVQGALEEGLRFDSPVQVVFRTTTRETEIRGVRIPEGATVAPFIGSANRDERRFETPDRFDPDRDTRGHLGFGFGKHFCLGASLARLEARAALGALAPELPHLVREGPITHIDSFLVRGPRRLPLQRVA